MLLTCSGGLRLREVALLRLEDIDIGRNLPTHGRRSDGGTDTRCSQELLWTRFSTTFGSTGQTRGLLSMSKHQALAHYEGRNDALTIAKSHSA